MTYFRVKKKLFEITLDDVNNWRIRYDQVHLYLKVRDNVSQINIIS